MYFYCYVYYIFLLLRMFCSVYSVFIAPTGTLWLPLRRFFCAFSSVVRQIPGYNSQRWGLARTLPNQFDHFGFKSQKAFQPKLLNVSFYVLFASKCVLYFCHRVSTQLQLTNISVISIIYIPFTWSFYSRFFDSHLPHIFQQCE